MAEVLVDFHKRKLSDAKETAKVFAWMVQAVAQKLGLEGPTTVPRQPKALPTPRLQLCQHELKLCAQVGELRCARCNRFARPEQSERLLRRSPCQPSPAAAGAANRLFSLTPHTYVPECSAAVAVAMQAADAMGVEPQPPPPLPAAAGRSLTAEVDAYCALGHEAESLGVYGRIIICYECGAYVVYQGRNPKLLAACKVRSLVASTRANERAQVSRALRGLHPRTGAQLATSQCAQHRLP